MSSFCFNMLLTLFLLQGYAAKSHSVGVIGVSTSGNHIRQVHPNTPASKAGLLNGDKVIKVVDEDGKHEITGPPYTEVTLTIERQVCNCKDCVCKEEKKSCQCSKIKEVKEFTIKRLPWQEVDCKETQDYFRNR